MPYKLSSYHVVSEPISSPDGRLSRLVYATRTGKTARFSDNVYSSLKSGFFSDLTQGALSKLFDMELLVPEGENEFLTILNRNKDGVRDNKALSVTIQPTANCQLGCTYCGQTHRKKNFSAELGTKVTKRIFSNMDRGSYRKLGVTWFGAEPLMAFREVLRLSDILIEGCSARGVDYEAFMVTNGLSLKPTIFVELSKRNCNNFQITLDGVAATHDQLRMTKKGFPTFNLIMKNVVAVTSTDEYSSNNSSISIRINVNKTSAPEVPALIELLSSYGLQDRKILLDFEPVIDWGGNGASANSYGPKEFAALEIEWILLARKAGFRFNRFLPRRITQPCMAVLPDGEVYDADGGVYPCYEFPYTEASSGPEYKLGDIDTIDEFRNDEAVTRQWNRDIETDISPCKKCNLFPVCGGACPKKWLNGERACPSFKDNIQERMALHFLDRIDNRVEPAR